ncbi:MAG: acyl-CoA synthetase [Porticoccus sp.]|nr:acyl-CoA synthetase [Porticoccus sp.]MBQ0807572.1 acyl-CoA synthetase [Porticoccus sp.]
MILRSLPLDLSGEVFPDDHSVAQQLDGRDVSWRDIRGRLDFWLKKLEEIPSIKVAVFHSDSVEFLSIILSLWHLKKIPVVPVNTLDETLCSVKKHTAAFVGEFDLVAEVKSDSDKPLDFDSTDDMALIIFTSGSSGTPSAIGKTFEQINAELEIIERQWGSVVRSALTVGTVSHHHMYGLPFCLLWPLVSGRPFLCRELIYFEQLLKLKNKKINIITSPAHLENLPELMDWKQLNGRVSAIFSAGSPLAMEAARNVKEKMSIAVSEVYGSTETGAVAWRERDAEEFWRPLCGIEVKSVQGRLAIKSPAAIKNEWLVSEDTCEIVEEQRFTLKGRADRIMKVGGKRVSASAIERQLEEHSWVEKACVVLLPQHKYRVGAVIQLTAIGHEKLVDLGKFAVQKQISTILSANVEKVAWPRYWRFVSQLPLNAQGKITAEQLKAQFHDRDRPRFPQVVESLAGETACEQIVDFVVPSDLLYLEGHFPGRPILPGVVQVSWAIHYGRELMGEPGNFVGLEGLKFQRVIRPRQDIQLRLQWSAQKSKLTFSYTSEEYTHSSGRIVFSGA